MYITSPITQIKGIGEKTAQAFEKMNIYTAEDVLFHFPRSYFRYPVACRVDEMDSMHEGMMAIKAVIRKTPISRATKSMNVTTLIVGGEDRTIELVWFRMPYVKNTLQLGKEYVFFGKVVAKNKRWVMEQPTIYELAKYETLEDTLQSVYSLTTGITNNLITKTIKTILNDVPLIQDYIPQEIRIRYHLCEYTYALKQIHFPDTMDNLIEAVWCFMNSSCF